MERMADYFLKYKMLKRSYAFFVIAFGINFFVPKVALAHCPLCTIGAGAVAVAAAWFGISSFSIGVFLGAFAIALGLWIGKLLKKQYMPHQTLIVGIISFFTTIIPLKPLFYDNSAILVAFSGDYGTWLNTTYLIDKFIIGSVIGAVIVLLGPKISKLISLKRKGKFLSYQGIILVFVLLLVTSLFYEFLA